MERAFRSVVVTCEHATNAVPREHAGVFEGARRVLAGHEGWDPGALELARALARAFGAPLHSGSVSRLLVELNRSPGNPKVFSRFVRKLPPAERDALFARYFEPYHAEVRRLVAAELAGRDGEGAERLPILHLSVHSFTPVFNGRTRDVDVGLLYDPARVRELELVTHWQFALRAAEPGWRVRRNRPYRGDADGLTTLLRAEFAPDDYLGLELEVSQTFPAQTPKQWRAVINLITRTLTHSP